MDPLFKALSYFRVKKYQESIDICTESLLKNPFDQSFWVLKMRCLTEQMYVDDLEADEDGIAETLLDENSISQISRPGTSLRTSLNSSHQNSVPNSSQSIRPVTQNGRPITGVIRPGTQSGRSTSLEQALRTPRTSRTARPLTSSVGRSVRLGTASMLNNQNEEFINLNRLNLSKYALLPNLNKSLYEYMLYIGNDVRLALNFAAQCTEQAKFKSWWWKKELGKCYFKIGLLRDAEKQFRSALNHSECGIDAYLWLGKIYLRLDQPLNALKIYKDGFEAFPSETFLKCYSARVYEALNDLENSSKFYRETLLYEPVNSEAIACIAMHYFYNDQPELALRYYRHLLQMGNSNSQIYNNIALCCFYSQQFDMVIASFERAIMNSDSDEITADCWYNCGLVVLATGDKQLAILCFKLALVSNSEHAEAYNNIGVVEMMMANSRNQNNPSIDQIQKSKSLFQTASSLGSHLYEPNYNLALIGDKNGQYDLCYEYVRKSLKIYPDHYASQQLFAKMKKLYENF